MSVWAHDPGKGKPAAVYKGEEGMDEVEICQFDRNPDSPETIEADARLITAAPELLEACWATIQYLNTRADPESNELWGKVSAAYRTACGIERLASTEG